MSRRVIATFDITIYNPSSHDEAEALDMQKLWYDLREEIEGFDFSASREQGHSYASIHHLVSGYDMGFYSYPRYVSRSRLQFSNTAN